MPAKPLSEDQIKVVQTLRADGVSWNAIGRMIGRSPDTVKRYLIDGYADMRQKQITTARAKRFGYVPRFLNTEERKHRGAKAGGLVNRIKGKLGLLKRNGWRGYGFGEYKPTPPKITRPRSDDKARVSIHELTNDHCRWPIGDPDKEGFGYCGLLEADLGNGRPYCPAHHARSRIPKTDARSKGRRSIVVFMEAAE